MSRIHDTVKRTNFAATSVELLLLDKRIKRSPADIHTPNATLIHSAQIIDGTWNISNASVPADWLCVALFDTSTVHDGNATSDTNTEADDYACMSQKDFARLYSVYGKYNKRFLALVLCLAIVAVLLLVVIAMTAGVLVWTDSKRRRLEREGVTYAPGGAFKAGEIGLWKGLNP
jgi:hypothetical protein